MVHRSDAHYQPLSLAEPTALDRIQSEHLTRFLEDQNLYEPAAQSEVREDALGILDLVVKAWVRRVYRHKRFPEFMCEEATSKIFTFGSYRLGVHGPGADIDALCVAPKHVTIQDFFGDQEHSLECMLKVARGGTVGPVAFLFSLLSSG
jgi:poly(A) polymerase